MTPWEIVQLARHPARPRPPDYVAGLVEDFVELRGDRAAAEDPALLCGVGRVAGDPVVVLAHRKEHGDAGAAALRKATRLIGLAERFGLTVLTFVDVRGGASRDGALWAAVGAIIERFLGTTARSVGVLCGEGVSGGALALCSTDRLVVLEHAYLAPVAPESISAVLWKTPERAAEAAAQSHLTATDLMALGLASVIVAEPPGGAHQQPAATIAAVRAAVADAMAALRQLAPLELQLARQERWSAMGQSAGARA